MKQDPLPGTLQYDHMVRRPSFRCFTLLCCFLSCLLLILYGKVSLTTEHLDYVHHFFESGSRKLLEWNASGSWPNYRYIWEDYYGEIPSFYNCSGYAAGNTKEISHYAIMGRILLEKEPNLTMECDHMRRRVMGNTIYRRVNHPYAAARNVFADYYLQELLLAFSYSPFNMYCYAIDKKSDKTFKQSLKRLGNCIPNVMVLEKEYDFDSGGHFQDEAHYDCTKELLLFRGWDYVMYLQNADVFIKTPEEISEIIGVLNGTALTGFSEPFKSRLPAAKSWTPKDLGMIKDPSKFTKEQILTPMKPRKSPNHMFLPREFVEAVEERLDLTQLFKLFHTKKYGLDEMLYATLLSAHFLKLPGQVENKCSVADYFRYVHWNFGNESKCQSFKKRHGVCLIGMEYVPLLKDKAQIIANKIWPEWDFGAIMCMGEVLYNRTNYPTEKKLNLKPYQGIPQVREHILKAQGKFNVSNFAC